MTSKPAQVLTEEATSLLGDGYCQLTQGWDELMEPDGAVRPGWQKMVSALNALGADELDKRQADAKVSQVFAGPSFHSHHPLCS